MKTLQATNVQEITEAKMNKEVDKIIDIKLRTAMQFAKGSCRDEGTQSWSKSVLERNAAQQIGPVVDAKQHRQWSKKTTNAFGKSDQTPEQDCIV